MFLKNLFFHRYSAQLELTLILLRFRTQLAYSLNINRDFRARVPDTLRHNFGFRDSFQELVLCHFRIAYAVAGH